MPTLCVITLLESPNFLHTSFSHVCENVFIFEWVLVQHKSLNHYWFIWTWILSLQSNNEILLPAMPRIPVLHTFNNDNAEDVQRKALESFHVSTFTSYTEFKPADSTILLVLAKNDNITGKTIKGKNQFWSIFYKWSRFSMAKSHCPHIIHVTQCQQWTEKSEG